MNYISLSLFLSCSLWVLATADDPINFFWADKLIKTDNCSWSGECGGFGDPQVFSMDGKTTTVLCEHDAVINLLIAYGFEVDVTCAGSIDKPNAGWIKELRIRQDDVVQYEHDAVECEELENESSYLKNKRRWDEVFQVYHLFNAAQKRRLTVSLSCRKRPNIKMDGNGGIQNTVLSVHLKLQRYVDYAGQSDEQFLADAIEEGVSGKCLPYQSIDVETFKVQQNKASYRKEVCKKLGLPFEPETCQMRIDAVEDDCLECYPDGPNGQSGDCHYCIRSTENVTCYADEDCCSNSCTDGQCEPETSFLEIPPSCCNPQEKCYRKSDGVCVYDGYCSECFQLQEICNSTRPCCDGLKCGIQGVCIPEQSIETCDCNATCHAVGDPLVRSFAWYSKHIAGNHDILYYDPNYNNGEGLEISFDSVKQPNNKGTWITKVYVNGDLFFSTSDCPVYTNSELPKCNRRKCLQKRDRPELGQQSFAESADVLLNGILPFTKVNDLDIEIHCVTKKRIDTGIPDHEHTRLDVFIHKDNSFQKSTNNDASEQNSFMLHMLETGVSGLCVEPFETDTQVINSLGDSKIDKWVKSAKIESGQCTCTSTNDDI